MVAILEQRADEVIEEGRAGPMDLFPDVVAYVVRTRGGGARRLGEHAGDLFLTEGEIILKTREVDVGLGCRRRGREKMV